MGLCQYCRYILTLTGHNTSLTITITITLTGLPVGCSLWTRRFLISGLNIRLVSAEMEQIRVGQDNVDVTNLSRAPDFLQLLHVSSGKERYFVNQLSQSQSAGSPHLESEYQPSSSLSSSPGSGWGELGEHSSTTFSSS